MKEINIRCLDNGRAILTTTDIHIANENKASKIVVDFSDTSFKNESKWCDVILKDGTSLRYDLGVEDVVEFELENSLTVPGMLVITPFVMVEDRKIKFIPNQNVVIRVQLDAGDNDAPERDDYIFELNRRVIELENEIIDGGEFEEV